MNITKLCVLGMLLTSLVHAEVDLQQATTLLETRLHSRQYAADEAVIESLNKIYQAEQPEICEFWYKCMLFYHSSAFDGGGFNSSISNGNSSFLYAAYPLEKYVPNQHFSLNEDYEIARALAFIFNYIHASDSFIKIQMSSFYAIKVSNRDTRPTKAITELVDQGILRQVEVDEFFISTKLFAHASTFMPDGYGNISDHHWQIWQSQWEGMALPKWVTEELTKVNARVRSSQEGEKPGTKSASDTSQKEPSIEPVEVNSTDLKGEQIRMAFIGVLGAALLLCSVWLCLKKRGSVRK